MSTTRAVPRIANAADRHLASAAAALRDWGQSVINGGSGKPSRTAIHGVEGSGKTSLGAKMPGAMFLMSRGETGLETLIDSGQLPPTNHFPETMTWTDAMSQLDWLLKAEHPHKTLVLDTLNGLERLCHEHVCQRDYAGQWGKQGFTSYMQGYEVALADWREMLTLLDKLREVRSLRIVALCHTKVAPFRNPEGADYDRYAPDMHAKTWSLTHKWADFVGFINFETVIDDKGPRAKGKGGQARILYTERHAAYDAKNRLGLPAEIDLGQSADEAWTNFTAALTAARKEVAK